MFFERDGARGRFDTTAANQSVSGAQPYLATYGNPRTSRFAASNLSACAQSLPRSTAVHDYLTKEQTNGK